jgi:hypothetical protein
MVSLQAGLEMEDGNHTFLKGAMPMLLYRLNPDRNEEVPEL